MTEPISIPTPEGSLTAVFHRAAGGKQPRYALLMCHGFRGSKEGGGRAAALAEKAAQSGFAVIRFDFTPISLLSRQIEEIAAAVSFCREKIGVPIIILGRSMGGSAALAYTAGDTSIAGLCLWSTPHNLAETFRLALGNSYDALVSGEDIDISDEFGRLHLTPAFIHDLARFDLLSSAAALNGRPLLVVHGCEDAIVPVGQAYQLFEQAGQPKKIVAIPGGDHQFLSTHSQAAQAVTAWLSETFHSAGP